MRVVLFAVVLVALGPGSARPLAAAPKKAEEVVAAYLTDLELRLEKSIAFVSTRENGPALWKQVNDVATGLLMTDWRNGTLQGAKAADAFYVRCDRTTMTQADLDQGVLVLLVGVARVRPAEFEILRLNLKTATRPRG